MLKCAITSLAWRAGRSDERKVILMPCMAPTDQLKLSSNQLTWSAGARFGNINFKTTHHVHPINCQLLYQHYFRNDEYEEAVEAVMSLGTAMFKVGSSYLADQFDSSSSLSTPLPMSGVNKIGVAAGDDVPELSEDERLHRLQVMRDRNKKDSFLLNLLSQVYIYFPYL